jgi:hypothetical protein
LTALHDPHSLATKLRSVYLAIRNSQTPSYPATPTTAAEIPPSRAARPQRALIAATCAWIGEVSASRCQTASGACQSVGTAAGIGEPVPPGHAPDPVRGLAARHPGSRDIQRAGGGPAEHRHGMSGGAEGGFGHAGHRAELRVRRRAQPRAGRPGQDRRSRRSPAAPSRARGPGLRAVAGARAGRTDPAGRAGPQAALQHGPPQVGEGGISGDNGGRPGAAGDQVAHVRGHKHVATRGVASPMTLRMPDSGGQQQGKLWVLR